MISQIRKKIINSKVKTNPFPYIFIRNIFDENYVDELNNFLPSYNNLNGKEIMFQSKSKSKKTILPSSRAYKQLSKKKEFRNLNRYFKDLKLEIIKKFNRQINIYVKQKVFPGRLKYHSSYSVMKKGYKKKPVIR